MRECGNLREWLENQGNPPYFTAEGVGGSMVLVVVDNKSFSHGIAVYNYREEETPFGDTHFWISSGWGIRREWLPAIKGFLNSDTLMDIGGAE